MTIEEQKSVELEIKEMLSRKTELTQEKQSLQTEFSEVKSKCSTRIPSREFSLLQTHRSTLQRRLGKIEIELGNIKNEIRSKQMSIDMGKVERRERTGFSKDEVSELVGLRDGYQSFSADPTRSPTMRTMAARFAQELSPIIKRMINLSTNGIE